MSPADKSRYIKIQAQELGFMFCGISKARRLDEEAANLDAWLNKGYQGKMQYLEKHFDMRLDPRLLVPGAKSVISLAFNYYPAQTQSEDAPKIARYAYGRDYHKVLKKKMNMLFGRMQEAFGEIQGRVFVDSAPLLERKWAELSGLGWIGKNGLLLNKKAGSYFFLAEIISDLELEADGPLKDYCGTCTACIDACPTGAILDHKTLDASKCISYLTIELKDAIPNSFKDQMQNWMFGCDICQEVCPWNRFSKPHKEPEFETHPDFVGMNLRDWEEITEEVFQKLFGNSALKRTGYKGLKRNIRFLLNKGEDIDSSPQ
jgi:epoxyqueuosine reductase